MQITLYHKMFVDIFTFFACFPRFVFSKTKYGAGKWKTKRFKGKNILFRFKGKTTKMKRRCPKRRCRGAEENSVGGLF